jgi:outer membrane protein assembly factor BamB
MRFRPLICVTLLVLAAAQAPAEPAWGWRTDGTGRYPQADPPLQWSQQTNVLWAVPMPGWSNATPILVGERIFVCSEPTTLLCVSAADGETLWQRTNSYMELLSPEQAAQAQRDIQKGDEILKKIDPLKKQFQEMAGRLKKTPKDTELRTKAKQVKKQIQALQAELKPLSTWRMPSTHPDNGYSSCTPTSDGEGVYALFGTGVAAKYDLEGNRKWMRLVEKPTQDYGHSASPLLVGETLVVHILTLAGLDRDTGEELWRVKAPPRWGSPVLARIGGNEPVAVTAGGEVVRVSDGRLLGRQLAALTYCAPVVSGQTVFFIEHGGKALALPAEPVERIRSDALWQTKPKNDRYYASPVHHDGLIYAVTQTGVFSAIDAGTGQVVYEKKLDLGKGTVFSSVTLAGSCLFISSDNGTTIVVQPGREFKQLAKNQLERFRSSPVFVGRRMYVRGYKKLYCIEKPTGPEQAAAAPAPGPAARAE